MKLSSPTVGPIIGYTTTNQTRIFLRGELEESGNSYRRCFGVIRWRPRNAKKWSSPLFNKLSLNFDMTGVFVLNGLSPDTEYEYQTGWFFADAELENINQFSEDQIEWPDNTTAFSTSTSSKKSPRSYVVGSCRYLLRLLGGAFFDDRGDKVFRSILEQIDEKSMPTHALLMIGDQIYADDLNLLSPDTRIEQFLERYRTVFSQEHIRRLMSRVPTYMILDDHEIEDNWPSKASEQDRVTLYPNAIHAYQIYQCSHSPLFDTTNDGRLDGTLRHFWYQFTDGSSDWFIMDVRTERSLAGANRRIVNDVQMKALLSWLNDGSGKVKLIVSSVPVFPDLSSDSDDKWGAFPDQRMQLLEFIRKNSIKKVVFVSGDVHCSFVSKLTVESDPGFAVYSIVSSSLFWPYPHTSESDFIFDEALADTADQKYVSKAIGPVYSDDNFARIDVDPGEIRVSFFERKGARLGKTVRLPF